MKIYLYKILFIFILIGGYSACTGFLDNELPSDQIPFEEGLKTESDLLEMLNSAYDVMANSFAGNAQKFAELLGEDVYVEGNTGFLAQIYNRSADFFNSDANGFYNQPYIAINRANTVLEQMGKVDLSDAAKKRIEGEAKAIRGICHLELLKLYAQPAGYTSDDSHLGIVIRTESLASPSIRNTVAEVYNQIISDLKDAENLLPENNGIYLNKYSAKAYLSRVFFYKNDFQNAGYYAKDIIENSGYSLSPDINNRYTQEIPAESFFYIVSTGTEDKRSNQFRDQFSPVGKVPYIKASEDYANLIFADTNDLRANNLTVINDGGSEKYAFTKFDLDYFNVSVISLTEIYLIAAESFAELGTETNKAIEYINAIKNRAGVNELAEDANAATIITEARLERRKEFGGEGVNLFDLKRRGAKGENIIIRGAPWNCPGMVLQFPASEITIKGFQLNEEGGCN